MMKYMARRTSKRKIGDLYDFHTQISYFCEKTAEKMKEVEMLSMYHSWSRIRIKHVISGFLKESMLEIYKEL